MRNPEVVAKMSGDNHWTKDPKNADAYRRMSSQQKGKPRPQTSGAKNGRARTVRCIENGLTFSTATEAAKAGYGGSSPSISCAIRKGCRAGGYHWEYA